MDRSPEWKITCPEPNCYGRLILEETGTMKHPLLKREFGILVVKRMHPPRFIQLRDEDKVLQCEHCSYREIVGTISWE